MVRFGRKAKRRPNVAPNEQSPTGASDEKPVQAAMDTLAETLDEAIKPVATPKATMDTASEPVPEHDDDATQRLLTSLGRFQRELKFVRGGNASDQWPDECMNQLLLSAEVALGEGWADLVSSLSDTGRILQSFENAGNADDALGFLDEAYEVLCLMVGDLIVDNVRDSVRDRWREVYGNAVSELERAGIALADDDGDGASDSVENITGGENELREGDDMPFDMPETKGAVASDEGLPTLDELPPLESLLTVNNGMGSPAVDDEIAEDVVEETPPTDEAELELLQAFSTEEKTEAPVEGDIASKAPGEEPPAPSSSDHGPSRIVVDIMDRICDELGKLEELSPGARPVALGTIAGGITALQQVVHGAHQDALDALCERMLAACHLLSGREAELDDRFTELGFAFCGVYVEAMEDGPSENGQAWDEECIEWMDSYAASPAGTEEPDASASDETAPAEPVADDAVSDEPTDSNTFEPLTRDNLEIVDTAAVEEETPAEIVQEPPRESASDTPNQLLESAQAAASKGDGASAKVLALQAAVNIAKQEVVYAEENLHRAEDKLKANLESAEAAREKVSATEKLVKAAAAMTQGGEERLSEAQQVASDVTRELEDFEAGVAELNRQIQELQAQRDAELEKVNDTIARREEAQRNEQAVQTDLQALRTDEDAARKSLESDRQIVKDLQRQISDIETEMESARDRLSKEKVSMTDISQTIQQLIGGEVEDEPSEPTDGMLF